MSCASLLPPFSWHRFSVVLAEFSMPVDEEIGLAVAVGLTLLGVGLHWCLPQQRMTLEERMKDGKVTEDEVRRRLRFYTFCARFTTLVGVALLLCVVAVFAEL